MDGMRESAERLKGTQKGKIIAELYDALDEYGTNMLDAKLTANEYRELVLPLKNKIMDLTSKMNRGGLATKR